MFKKFPGSHLIEIYQNAKKEKRQEIGHHFKKLFAFIVTLIITLMLWNAPASFYGLEGLTIVQQRVIAIFVFSTFMWLFEIIPTWATSVTLIVVMLLTVSNSAFSIFMTEQAGQELGTLINYKSIMGTFADPIIMLFIGGFVLSISMSKCGLDMYLARTLLKPFGVKSKYVLLGFLIITGIFSMFVSNTATAAMMITLLVPVFKSLPPEGKGRIALALSIPIAANIGGMATPIGTPPNAIALKYLNDPLGANLNIGFGEWMAIMLPFTIIMLFISWFLLLKLFPFKQKEIHLKLEGKIKKDFHSYVIYITVLVTVLLWMLDKVTGVKATVVAMIPLAVFSAFGVFSKDDLEEINWSVIWMVAGGFALGLGLNASGLADLAIQSIPFNEWLPVIVLIVGGIICYLLSNFISNTATAALMVPILALVCTGMGSALAPIGGIKTILICIAIAASSAMLLPISTPPNALAYSTGLIKQSDMMKIGIIVGIISLTLGFTFMIILGKSGILG